MGHDVLAALPRDLVDDLKNTADRLAKMTPEAYPEAISYGNWLCWYTDDEDIERNHGYNEMMPEALFFEFTSADGDHQVRLPASHVVFIAALAASVSVEDRSDFNNPDEMQLSQLLALLGSDPGRLSGVQQRDDNTPDGLLQITFVDAPGFVLVMPVSRVFTMAKDGLPLLYD